MGDPIELRLRGYTLTIRIEDAKNIEVKEENPHDFCIGRQSELRQNDPI